MNNKIVILGTQCFLSGTLQGYGMRGESLPFDWTMTTSLSGVTRILEQRFRGYLDREYLSNDSHLFDMTHFGAGRDMITSTLYPGLYTRHHDIIGNEKERCNIQRRIDRLLKLLDEPGDTCVIFMRYLNDGYLTQKLQTNCSKHLDLTQDDLEQICEDIEQFQAMLGRVYPNVIGRFKLLLFTANPELLQLIQGQHFKNVRIALVSPVSIPSKQILQKMIAS